MFGRSQYPLRVGTQLGYHLMGETDKKYIKEIGNSYNYYNIITLYCSVVVTTSSSPVPSINNTGHVTDWFDSLAECLHWNVRRQQKKL